MSGKLPTTLSVIADHVEIVCLISLYQKSLEHMKESIVSSSDSRHGSKATAGPGTS